MSVLALAHSLCPTFLQPQLERIETSPLGYRLARGAFWSLMGSLISRGLAVFSSILVARMLGKVGFGELGIIQGSISMFGLLAGLGLGITATKHVAELRVTNPARAARIIRLSSLVSLISGGALTIVLIIFAPWLSARILNAPHLAILLRYSAPLLVLGAWTGAQSGALAGFEAFKRIAQVNLVTGIISFPLMVGGALFLGLIGAVWGLVGASLVGCLINSWALRGEMRNSGIPVLSMSCLGEWPMLWKFSLPSLLGGILVGPVTWMCTAMLVNKPNGYAEMGVFNATNQWFNILFFLPGIIGSVALPVLCEKIGDQDVRAIRRVLSISMRANLAIILPMVIFICIFSSSIMSWYGNGFAESWAVLVVATCTAGLVAIQSPIGNFMVASGKMWLGLLMNLGWGISFLAFTYLFVGYGSFGLALARFLAYLLHALWTFGFAVILIRESHSPQKELVDH